MVVGEQLIGSRYPLYTAQQTPNKAEIRPDSKMSCVAQKLGQKRAKIIQ